MAQEDTILKHLKEYGNISTREAMLEYNVTRLAARIWNLKNDGYQIETEMRENPITGVRYARYHLESANA